MRNLLLVIALNCVFIIKAQQSDTNSTDSTLHYNLHELVVNSSRAYVQDNKIIILPTRQEKNLSNSPESLIAAMHLPFVKISGGTMYGPGNRRIDIYINGLKASETDLAAFWTSNVQRVEYIDNPTESEYAGTLIALNYVVKDYILGGVTKVNGFQQLPNNGNYYVASKLVYKKMTYGVLARGGYFLDNLSRSSGTDVFKDVSYNGNNYEVITKQYEGIHQQKSHNYDFTFNAKYHSENFRVLHKISLNRFVNPNSNVTYSEHYTPEITKVLDTKSYNTLRAWTTNLSGTYYWKGSPKFAINASWNYIYSNQRGKSGYKAASDILNGYNEKIHSLDFNISPYYRLSNELLTQVKLSGDINWYDTQYSGYSSSGVNQWRSSLNFGWRWCWVVRNNFWVDATPGLFYSNLKSGRNSNNAINPLASLNANWSINDKSSLRVGADYMFSTPQSSTTADIVIAHSLLIYISGNPLLKDTNRQRYDISYIWMPKRWLRIWCEAVYRRINNDYYAEYVPYSKGGLLLTPQNAGSTNRYGIETGITANFFNNKLSITMRPEYAFSQYSLSAIRNLSDFRISGNVDYTLENIRFSLSYNSPKIIDSGAGTCRYHRPSTWECAVTYGNRNFFVSVAGQNLFQKKLHDYSTYFSPNYITIRDGYTSGRKAVITISYTFDYGKKTDRNIEIDSPATTEGAYVGKGI